MGGKKKIGLKQMERMQDKKDEEESKKKKEKAAPPRERKPVGVIPPDAKSDKILSEIKKMQVLTPYSVSTRFGVRMSAAKDFLDQLEKNGSIQMVSGNHSIKIYKPA